MPDLKGIQLISRRVQLNYKPMLTQVLQLYSNNNRLGEPPTDPDKIYIYEGKKYGQPKFRIKTTPATELRPASDAFSFEKDENTGTITLRCVIEVYRDEPDVIPLNIKNPGISLEFEAAGKKISKPLTITQSPAINAVNLLQDLHAQTTVTWDEIQGLFTHLREPGNSVAFQFTATAELWWEELIKTSSTASFRLLTVLETSSLLTAKPATAKPFSGIVARIRDHRGTVVRPTIKPPPTIRPTPGPAEGTPQFKPAQKLDIKSIIIRSYTKDDTLIFGPFAAQLNVKDLSWQIVNIPKAGENYTISYQPTYQADVFNFLPQVFRIKAKEQSGEPRISISMNAGADEKPENYKINIALTLIPYYNPLAKKDLYRELNRITKGVTRFCELRLGGYKSAKFELRSAYAGENAVFTGKMPASIDVIDPVNGFVLNVECTLESFDYFRREISEGDGIIIGDIVFELVSGKDDALQTSVQRIPVELNIGKLAGIPISIKPDTENIADVIDIKGFTIYNENSFPVAVKGIDVTLLSQIEETVYEAEYDPDLQATWPLELPGNATQQVLLTERQPAEEEASFWTQVVCDPYGISVQKKPDEILERLIDYATGDPQLWKLEVSCPLFERWGQLDDATITPFKQVSHLIVEVKNEKGATFSVKLDQQKPVANIEMSRSISEILKTQQLTGRKYQYRVGTNYVIQPAHWTEWSDPESTASDYLTVVPHPLSQP